METTITLAHEIKRQLAELQAQLRADRGRPVTYNEVIEYLLEARAELARLMQAEYGGGT